MTEQYPDDNELLQIISDTETGVEYIPTGTAPYYLHFRKLLYRLLLATKPSNDLCVLDEYRFYWLSILSSAVVFFSVFRGIWTITPSRPKTPATSA